jgi:multisubunit Na+/H+ antiporter MnhB subunit
MKTNAFLSKLFLAMLSSEAKKTVEKVILFISIISFIIHLVLIYLVKYQLIDFITDTSLFKSPIAAIYTPFSFILIYEVYLLVYYIPKSVTTYVSKQYEIITLIVIRRIFKDLSNLELSQDWLNIKSDRQFTYDIILSIVLFYLIYLFKNNITVYVNGKIMDKKERYDSFVGLKKTIAVFLVPALIVMAAYNLFRWSNSLFNQFPTSYMNFKNINNVFFEDFFTLLIVVDVLLLLISFFYSDSFQKVMRNSGFIISTILIRLSFATEGSVNNVLILSSIIFGLLILLVHNQFEKKEFMSLEVK